MLAVESWKDWLLSLNLSFHICKVDIINCNKIYVCFEKIICVNP